MAIDIENPGAHEAALKAAIGALADDAISAAAAGIVDGAPADLDTLDKLAAAIGDDADFAGTVATALSGKSNTGHTHDDRYYTEGEIDTALGGKSDTGHTHDDRYYTEGEIDTALGGKSNTSHTHDDRYYTEGEVDTLLAGKQAADTDLDALAANSTNGFWARTGAGAGAARTFTASLPLVMANGAGAAANPNVSLPSNNLLDHLTQDWALADDTSVSFDLPSTSRFVVCLIAGAGQSTLNANPWGIYFLRGSGSPVGLTRIEAASVANVDLTNGSLSGTTGVDGRFTIAAHSDGKVYMENRSGAPRSGVIIFLSR